MPTRPKHPPVTKPRSIASISAATGVSRGTLRTWRDNEGIDITDEAAVKARAALRQQSRQPSDILQARLAKIAAETDRIRFAHEVERKNFVPAHEIRAEGIRIGGVVRTALDRLAQELPPQLAGRTAPEINVILKRVFRETQDNLSKYKSHIQFDETAPTS